MPRDKKIKKKNLGSYPFASVIFSVSLALILMGLFSVLIISAGNLTRFIQENIEVQVFLNKNLSENEKIKIIKTLSVKDYVIVKDGEPAVVLVTKEEAARQFMEDTGNDFVAFLGDNPLRDFITIKINPDFHSNEGLAEIKKEIEYIRGVYEVSYVEDLAATIQKNVKLIGGGLLIFITLLLVIVVILIHNTIKLALFSQRFLIRSMQLVGATAGFIRKPFLYRAFGYGMLSGMISIVVLVGLLNALNNSVVEGLLTLVKMEELAVLSGTLLLLGALVGYFSTYAAMKKYMKLSLDELY